MMPFLLLAALDPAPAATPFDDLEPAELAYLERQATQWIRGLEERHRPHARALSGDEKAAFSGFFRPELLERARLRVVAGIENPDFFSLFTDSGRPLPIDFRQVSGLALVDTVLVVGSRVAPGADGWLPLLFHELVHLAQVEALGEAGHVADYVRGWAAHGFRYRTIPQEEQAYELAARFRAAPDRPFPVAAEVERRFGAAGR